MKESIHYEPKNIIKAPNSAKATPIYTQRLNLLFKTSISKTKVNIGVNVPKNAALAILVKSRAIKKHAK